MEELISSPHVSSSLDHSNQNVLNELNEQNKQNEQNIALLLCDDPSETKLSEEFFSFLGVSPCLSRVIQSMEIQSIQDYLIFINSHSEASSLNIFREKLRNAKLSLGDPKVLLNQLTRMISALMLNDRIVNIFSIPTEEIISLGDSLLDQVSGGFMTTKVIEIAGSPGCGKSTLALQLCIQACCPEYLGGLDGRALYINTDGKFSLDRLKQMIEAKIENLKFLNHSLKNDKQFHFIDYDMSYFENHIIVQDGVPSVDEFDGTLEDIDRFCKLNTDIRLVVIDTIGSIYRGIDTGKNGIVSRAKVLCNTMKKLKKIAENYNVCVLTINQVSAIIDDLNPLSSLLNQNKIQASLGLVWSNSLNARIILEMKENSRLSTATSFSQVVKRKKLNNQDIYYIDHQESISIRESKLRREMRIEFSSYHTSKPQKCNFTIDNRGLIGLGLIEQ